jgi:imidazolonepropionase-like amidohydrolase
VSLTLRGATLIDGTGRDPVDRAVVAIERDRITSVGTSDASGETLDLDGLTLLPGLIDAHTHLGLATELHELSAPGSIPLAQLAAQIFTNVELALEAGFTTVREVGGLDGGVARAVELGLLRGPRVLPAGPLISQTGGHGDHRPQFAILDHPHGPTGVMDHPGLVQMMSVCDGPDEVRIAARRAFRHGATHIKVCVSGGVVSLTDRLEDTQLSVPELRAAVEEAHARETYVTAHAHNVRGILNGLEAGIECFEHATFLDEETANKLALAGAAIVPTLAVVRLLRTDMAEAFGLTEDMIERAAGAEQAMANSMKLAIDAGVTVGSGSDLLGPRQNRRGLELALHAEVVGAMEAIVQSTATNARIIRRAHDLGTVEEGKLADLIAVDGDPLTEPELFDDPSRVKLVVKDGRIEKGERPRA